MTPSSEGPTAGVTTSRIRRCPNARCRSKTGLEIIAGSFRANGVRLVSGCWDLRMATELSTDDEIVRCLDCGHVFALTQILL
jgi:hypothetical protein